jgi:hypothetical protein
VNELEVAASGNRDLLSCQSVVDRGSKITAHLDPVLVPIRPSSKVKAHSAGREVDRISLRCWFFGYPWMIGGNIFQEFNYALQGYAAGHIDRDFDRAVSVRKGPVGYLIGDDRPVWNNDFGPVRRCE